MTAQTKVQEPPEQSLYEAWANTFDDLQRANKALNECLVVLDMEADRRASEGRDELNLRAFTKRIRREMLS